MALLEVNDLKTHFFTREGVVQAVDGVSFSLEKGKTLGIVGESGCGKSVTALSIMGLIPKPPAKIVGGEVLFDGTDLTKLSEGSCEHIRGNEVAMIFQDPMTSLNPTLQDRDADHGDDPPRTATSRSRRRASARSSCSKRSGSRARPSGSTTIRTASPAA